MIRKKFPLEFPFSPLNIAQMSSSFRIRRATVDDLGTLRPMWESMRLASPELERQLTEFQVAVDPENQVVAGVGFQIAERHANIHSEAFSDFALTETLRPMLWTRMQALAMNHGIARLWTQESAPFWKQNGFLPATAEELAKLPSGWISGTGPWLTLSLKNEESIRSGEQELAIFMAAEKQRTARAFQHAKTLKKLATVVAIIFAIFVAGALFFLLKKNRGY